MSIKILIVANSKPMNTNKKGNSHEKKMKPSTIVYAIIVFIIAYILIVGFLIYGFGVNNRLTQTTSKIIPYPAAIIGSKKIITINELNDNLQAVRKFYENQDFSQVGMRVDFTTEDGQKRLKIREKQLFNKMIENKVIEILAKERGINITAETVDQNVKRKLDEYGTAEEAKANLEKLYGWTLDDFKNKVVRPSLYAEELEKSILDQNKKEFSAGAQTKINEAKKELDGKADFAETAKQYSEGATAREGGELGWFAKNQLIPEVAEAAFSLKKGATSGVIESELGYHIIEVEDKKTENGSDLVKIRQIFAKKTSFADWLDEEIKNLKIYVPLKDFYWNKEKGIAEFRSDDMKKFEKNLLENYQGDASIIF